MLYIFCKNNINCFSQRMTFIILLSNKKVNNILLETTQDLELILWTIFRIQGSQNGNSRIYLEVKEKLVAGAYSLKVENCNGSIGHLKLIK